MKTRTFLCLLFFYAKNITAQQVLVIPEPVSVTKNAGYFYFNSSTRFIYPDIYDFKKTISMFAEEFKTFSGIDILKTKNTPGSFRRRVIVKLAGDRIKKEGYILDISEETLQVTASDAAGVFYAFQTIRQLFSPSLYFKKSKIADKYYRIPCGRIVDYPRYAYRGMHLDVSRHFFSTEFIKRYLDILAMYKINTFHWHLTDSHGWRLQIKQYPRLTSIGAWRADRSGIPMTIAEPTLPGEAATYGGYYTQEQVKEIIRYAKDRFITIIPEIEMPGHCTAALVAYPKYNDLNNPVPLRMPCGYPGDLKHNFCVGYDSTYIFLQNILKEVMALFPSSFIHIGGDEVRGEPWLNCPRCLNLMKQKGLTTALELQGYFTRRIDSFIVANGRHTIGWEEILSAHVAPGSVAMAWHTNEMAIEDVRKGYNVVMTPYRYTYFDFYQSDPQLESYITYAPLFLDTVYAFNPSLNGLSNDEALRVLGTEACLWTENVETAARVEYMLLPRLMGLAEVAWSPAERKNYTKFIDKTEAQFKRLDALGISYSKSMYNVAIRPRLDSSNNGVNVILSNQTPAYPVYYTTNGSNPSSSSKKYIEPFTVSKNVVIKAGSFRGNKLLGKVSVDSFSIHKAFVHAVTISPAKGIEFDPALAKLTDGIFGTVEPYDGRWVWMTDSIADLTIDLQKQQALHSIKLRCMEDQVSNIFLPAQIHFFTSTDGIKFKKAGSILNKKIPQQKLRHIKSFSRGLSEKCRFIKITISNANIFPEKEKNLMFFDEIVVEFYER